MRNQRLGCFTTTGILATLFACLAVITLLFLQGGDMFSPGALNAQAGQPLNGVTSHAQAACRDCHSAPWEFDRMADRCAACHTGIAAQMMEAASLHGTIDHLNPGILCSHCHPDHRGADAPLTVATMVDFPHDELGYSLNGHQLTVTREAFVCDDCHTNGVSAFDQAICQTCHEQVNLGFAQTHLLEYGADCLACHDGVDRFGATFSHDAFPFRLEGKHGQLKCADCHASARSLNDFRAAPADCASCHQKDDPHAGQFGSDCGACHNAEVWKPAKFDHNLSAFKLEGEHAEVACEGCHQNGVYKGTPTECYSCHAKDDEHGGRFGTDCGSCHTPNDWDEATFDHNKSAFPLTGAHERVQCERCHTAAQFAGMPSACASCHQDPVFHAGAFGASCESCHSTSVWSPAKYNGPHPGIADEGGFGVNHGGATCKTCHTVDVYSATCTACHSGGFEGGEGGDDD